MLESAAPKGSDSVVFNVSKVILTLDTQIYPGLPIITGRDNQMNIFLLYAGKFQTVDHSEVRMRSLSPF